MVPKLLAIFSLIGASWQMGPFERLNEGRPIITPDREATFYCPVQKKGVSWEMAHTFNPAAIVADGQVHLIYRAEDDYGDGVGYHTSRLGLAMSSDGAYFEKRPEPILFPDNDPQAEWEFPGGCEDPRIVETEDGTYVMTYTQWNRKVALLAIATSKDLIHWDKHGYAFEGELPRRWSKSGSIVCRLEGDRLIATPIQGKYWMFWGEGDIHLAKSDDLIHWEPYKHSVLSPRKGYFDSALVEPGPPALLTEEGILLLYNGKNLAEGGDPSIKAGAYSAGQALFSDKYLGLLKGRSYSSFLSPQTESEQKGQYLGGTVFIEALVPHKGHYYLYYGMADSSIGVARCPIEIAE